MAEVFPKDVLLRCGGRTLQRHGVAAVAGARRGAVDVPLTFARADGGTPLATYIDRDGILRLAAANNLRVEWVDLDGDGIRETPGLLLEGSRQNLIENCDYEVDAVGSAIQAGTSVARSTAQALRGSASLLVTCTNNGDSGVFITKRDGTRTPAAAGTTYTLSAWVYAPAASVGKLLYPMIQWFNAASGGAQVGGNVGGTVVALVAGWQRISVIGLAPATTVAASLYVLTNGAQGAIQFHVDVPQFEAGAFMSSAIPTGTGAVTRAADSLTLPFNFGPQNVSILSRMARPVHADAVGNTGVNAIICYLGGSAPQNFAVGYFLGASRQFECDLDTTGTDVGLSTALPAGATLTFLTQLKNLTTGGQIALDVGSGLTAFSSAASGFSAFGSQTLVVGTSLYGVLLDLLVVRDLRTLAEMLAIP